MTTTGHTTELMTFRVREGQEVRAGEWMRLLRERTSTSSTSCPTTWQA